MSTAAPLGHPPPGTEQQTPGKALLGAAVVAVLAIDAVLALVVAVLYLPSYLGAVAFPISALGAGLVNILLVLGASTVSRRALVLFVPLAAWLVAFLGAASPGPGGDIPLASDWRTLLLFGLGLVPAMLLLFVISTKNRGASRRLSI